MVHYLLSCSKKKKKMTEFVLKVKIIENIGLFACVSNSDVSKSLTELENISLPI